MVINYGTNENWRWDGTHAEARFEINNNGQRVTCRVTQEWIEDNLGNPQGQDKCFDAAKLAFDQITDLVGERIAHGRFEKNGSILIRTFGA